MENSGRFQKGHKRSQESIERQRETILAKMDSGKWHYPPTLDREGQRKRGRKNLKPVGARRLLSTGYVQIKTPRQGWMFEHRYVMQESLGRKLTREEEVHHRNGQRDDNRLENLAIVPRRKHEREKFPRCPICCYIHPPH